MKNVLRITASITDAASVSSLLTGELIAGLDATGSVNLQERDFSIQGVPHLDNAWLAALAAAEADRDESQQQKAAYSNRLVAEVQAADLLVIGLPMYNFSLPSMLKAWIDHIARAGVTFRYTENGAVGLLQDKKVYLVATMGGEHETAATDFLRPYMKFILGFIGLRDIEFVTADGLNLSPERREQGIAAARSKIERILADYRQNIAEQEIAA